MPEQSPNPELEKYQRPINPAEAEELFNYARKEAEREGKEFDKLEQLDEKGSTEPEP